MADNIIEVTDASFQAEVIESETPVLVDFWAPWCGPCRVVAPVLEEIAQERDNLRIVKLNVDENQVTAANGVRALGFAIVAVPSARSWKHTLSRINISPSSLLKVPRPKSPCRSNSAIVTSPSYTPSSNAPIIEV